MGNSNIYNEIFSMTFWRIKINFLFLTNINKPYGINKYITVASAVIQT